MSGGNWTYPKTWGDLENLTNEDLNAEFQTVLANADANGTGTASVDVAHMQQTLNPGNIGTEVLPESVAEDIQELRFVLQEVTGESQWYVPPATSLKDLQGLIGGQVLSNRVVSGLSRASGQPNFLLADGTLPKVSLKASVTPFVAVINGTKYTQSADLSITNLVTAPPTNNTAALNDAALVGDYNSEFYGEEDQFNIAFLNPRFLNVDAVGSNILARQSLFSSFVLNGEFLFGKLVEPAATFFALYPVYRGFFFDNNANPVPRHSCNDNDVMTLLKTAYIFFKGDTVNGNSIFAIYTDPVYSGTAPSSPSTGDMWFDSGNNVWKQYNGATFAINNSILIGIAASSTTACVATRSLDFAGSFSDVNTLELSINTLNNDEILSNQRGATLSSYGTVLNFGQSSVLISAIQVDPDNGGALSTANYVYVYCDDEGNFFMSNIAPHNRNTDLLGWYHPYSPWRCVGTASWNGSSFIFVRSFLNKKVPFEKLIGPVNQTSQTYSGTGSAGEIEVTAFTFRGTLKVNRSFIFKPTSITPFSATSSIFAGKGTCYVRMAIYRVSDGTLLYDVAFNPWAVISTNSTMIVDSAVVEYVASNGLNINSSLGTEDCIFKCYIGSTTSGDNTASDQNGAVLSVKYTD